MEGGQMEGDRRSSSDRDGGRHQAKKKHEKI